jgi:hypothetical protein
METDYTERTKMMMILEIFTSNNKPRRQEHEAIRVLSRHRHPKTTENVENPQPEQVALWRRMESSTYTIRGCVQKFSYWLPGARTANGTALCH